MGQLLTNNPKAIAELGEKIYAERYRETQTAGPDPARQRALSAAIADFSNGPMTANPCSSDCFSS